MRWRALCPCCRAGTKSCFDGRRCRVGDNPNDVTANSCGSWSHRAPRRSPGEGRREIVGASARAARWRGPRERAPNRAGPERSQA
eukprot:5816993-Pyramimonas_sp.AAC.1